MSIREALASEDLSRRTLFGAAFAAGTVLVAGCGPESNGNANAGAGDTTTGPATSEAARINEAFTPVANDFARRIVLTYAGNHTGNGDKTETSIGNRYYPATGQEEFVGEAGLSNEMGSMYRAELLRSASGEPQRIFFSFSGDTGELDADGNRIYAGQIFALYQAPNSSDWQGSWSSWRATALGGRLYEVPGSVTVLNAQAEVDGPDRLNAALQMTQPPVSQEIDALADTVLAHFAAPQVAD